MSYGDDQCVRYGGIRVAKSTLCADCLEKERAFLVKRIEIKNVAIKELKEENKRLANLCERLLDHIIQNIVYESNLDEQIRKYWGRV